MAESVVFILEIIGTIAFAISGAMLAIRKHMDIFGVCVLGVVTAVGGGMIRDMVLCLVPTALTNPVYTITAAAVSLLVFIFACLHRKWHSQARVLYDWLIMLMDAVGLGVFTVVGITCGIQAGHKEETFLLVFLGVITGVGGGLLRDMMAQEQPYILHKHIYACASIVGALVYIALMRTVGSMSALVVSPVVVVVIRIMAAYYRWNLPKIEREP